MVMGQDDDRLPGTDRMLTDIAMVPPILMAGLKTATYKTKTDWRDVRNGDIQPVWREYPTRFQTVFHEPWKGKRRSSASPSGVQPTDSVGNCID